MFRMTILTLAFVIIQSAAHAENIERIAPDPYCGIDDDLSEIVCDNLVSGFFFGVLFAEKINRDRNGNRISCLDEKITPAQLSEMVKSKYRETPEQKDVFEVIARTMFEKFRCQ